MNHPVARPARPAARPNTGIPELDALLTTGPFCAALREAIRARGLTLDRIQAKLGEAGTPVSLAALSHWQSGRSQPEREASLAALGVLERILGLRPAALAALLEEPRPRGRRSAAAGYAIAEIYHDKSAVIEALRDIDPVWSGDVVRVSMHDRVVVGADGLIHCQSNRLLLRATVNGPDRILALYNADEGENTLTITPVRGCSLGQVVTDHRSGLVAAELLFGHPLRLGEFHVMEHRLDFSEPFIRDVESTRRFPQPLREYVLEVEFAAARTPSRCVQITSPAIDSEDYTERMVSLDEYGRATAVALDFGPGQFGIRWAWED
jgi:transcriptional regulator with XRE-family HTH domain